MRPEPSPRVRTFCMSSRPHWGQQALPANQFSAHSSYLHADSARSDSLFSGIDGSLSKLAALPSLAFEGNEFIPFLQIVRCSCPANKVKGEKVPNPPLPATASAAVRPRARQW